MQVEAFGVPTQFADVPDGSLFFDPATHRPGSFGIAVSMSGAQKAAIVFQATGPILLLGWQGCVHVVTGAILQCEPSSAVAAPAAPHGAVIRTADDAFMAVPDKNGLVRTFSLNTGLYVSFVNSSDVVAFTGWEAVTLQVNNSYKSLFAFDASKYVTVPLK